MPSPWPTRLESGHCHGLLPPPATGPIVQDAASSLLSTAYKYPVLSLQKQPTSRHGVPALADSPTLIPGVPFCCIGPPSVLPQTPGSFSLGVLLACSSWLLSLPALRGWRPPGACISADNHLLRGGHATLYPSPGLTSWLGATTRNLHGPSRIPRVTPCQRPEFCSQSAV